MNNLPYYELVHLFNNIFYVGICIISILSCLYIITRSGKSTNTNSPSIIIGLTISVALSILFAYYPIEWGTYSDREGYLYVFQNQGNASFTDWAWQFINQSIAFYSYEHINFFIILAMLYICIRYYACYILSKRYHLIFFIMMITSFMFLGYGVNTIRSGIASSFLFVALSIPLNTKKDILLSALICLIAIGIHKSMALPVLSFLIAHLLQDPKKLIRLWFISFLLSFFFGSFFESILGDFIEENAGQQAGNYILSKTTEEYNRGFRIDFIIYSAIPIIMGWYYIIKKNFVDKKYLVLYSTYILSNIFFILVIRANFVDRFGYLSWFLMPVILIYPLVKKKMFEKQNNKIALILFCNTLFTFLMFLRG